MAKTMDNLLIYICIVFTILKSVNSISCYHCSGTDSENPFECNEFLESDTSLEPNDCTSIHNAQYCIKHVGRFEGAAIECYQCNTSTSLECSDGLMNLDGGILRPTPCDHVHNAQYCIKLTACTQGEYYNFIANNFTSFQVELLLGSLCISHTNKMAMVVWENWSLLTGGISTKRYCSSLDLGNLCNYVQHIGDKLEYRTCIYTCSTDGCNSATTIRMSATLIIGFIFKYLAF